ncbi:DUF5710 domain-containing protein [Campylobacter helveticus]|uniref:DUF5710 domain-containing protein n=1 Tax=Campylobacter helveticus TaxID=28898 RepID=UPI0022EABB52|nr:DUF5710 domain-containing protein [Campylobacter helveticus]
MPRSRKYLFVPYNERQEAKNLGAIWDFKEKKFFAPYYLEQSLFEKWSKEREEVKPRFQKTHSYQNIDTNEALFQFKTALQNQGFIIDTPIMNGKIQRCKVDGDRGNEKSGAYLGHLDEYPAGFMQNHKTGFKMNWKFELSKDKDNTSLNYTHHSNFKQNSLNISQRSSNSLNANYKEKQEQKELKLLALQRKTALRLEKEYKESKKAPLSHKYLLTKGLKQDYSLRVDRFNNLLIPLQDSKGKFWSLQRISESGSKIIGVIKGKEEKDIEYSARKRACFYTQVPLKEHKQFYLCEGFATAISLQELLKEPVIMGVDAGNLKAVIKDLKQEYPNTKITLFADNDLKASLNGKVNIGLESAKAIKKEFKDIIIIIPELSKEEALQGMSDFNDIYVKYGFTQMQKRIESSLNLTDDKLTFMLNSKENDERQTSKDTQENKKNLKDEFER